MNMKVLVVVGLLGAAFLVGGGVTLGPQNNDDMRATAAVAQAGAAVSPDGAPTPGPQPAPGPKPPRSKCEYCNGTGVITHGDGHKTECTYCEPDKDGPDGPFTAKKCCVDCTCKKCNCKYPGQCLVEANGGEPVKICDEETGECRFYAAPDYEFVQPAPKPVVDPQDLYRLQELKASATRCYKNKDYVMTFKYIQGIDNVLSHMGPSDVVEQYRKDATKARRNLEKKIYLLDKAAYDKFLSEFNTYQANEAKKYADAQTESCSSGSCSGGEVNQFWFREGSQNIWGRQMNSEGGCSSGSCGMSGGGCSSCN